MTFSRILLGTMLLLASGTAAFAISTSVSLEDRRQAACYNDVQRLCGNLMPDADKITVCMKDKKAQVSARCAAMYEVTK
jgi:hypothetical protein